VRTHPNVLLARGEGKTHEKRWGKVLNAAQRFQEKEKKHGEEKTLQILNNPLRVTDQEWTFCAEDGKTNVGVKGIARKKVEGDGAGKARRGMREAKIRKNPGSFSQGGGGDKGNGKGKKEWGGGWRRVKGETGRKIN